MADQTQRRGHANFPLTTVVVLVALLAGGGARSGLPGDTVLQLVTVPLLISFVSHSFWTSLARISKLEYAIILLLLAIPFTQLVPLPPSIWVKLPQADIRLAVFGMVGLPLDWRPISLAPDATATAVMSLLPPIAVFFAVRALRRSERRALVLVVLCVAAISVFLGLAQLAGGPQSLLRFYSITNPDEPVGFFANRNHYAAFLYVSAMLTAPFVLDSGLAILQAGKYGNFTSARLVILIASLTLLLLLFFALIIARSRAGLALGLLAMVAAAVLLVTEVRNRWRLNSVAILAVALVVVGLIGVEYGSERFVDRLGVDPRADARVTIMHHAIEAIDAYLPLGSGIGTFQNVYAGRELSTDLLGYAYVNAAHDDWLQILVEAGAAGAACLGLFLVWVGMRAVELFRVEGRLDRPLDLLAKRAALFSILFVLLHSFIDYPLRTSANMVLFAILCALVDTPPRQDTSEQKSGLPQPV